MNFHFNFIYFSGLLVGMFGMMYFGQGATQSTGFFTICMLLSVVSAVLFLDPDIEYLL